jgi:hypothetical protein
VRQDFDKVGIGFNHFLVYFTARAYWSGYEPAAALREYCRLFYGPAENEMLSFFTFCEANWKVMDEDKAKADEALALFDKAKAKTDAASVFGKRLALIDDFLKGLRMKSQQLGQKRGPVPTVRLVGDAKDIVIDGKLDDDYWQNCPAAATGKFRELQTGRVPTFGTSFKAGWQGSSVFFAIRCDERRGEKLNITATREDDQAIWHGDAIEIELATETHSYYSIAISPNGHIVDLDRGAPRGQWFTWDSKAEVATHIADDHWTVEIRIPVTQDENDPLHQVIGRKPTQSLPWHINLCRQRIREDGQEHSALSPTGVENFHEPMKFAHFYDGRSHSLRRRSQRHRLRHRLPRCHAAAQWAAGSFLALAEGKITDFQKSAALEQAAQSAQKMGKQPAFIDQIPIEAVRKTAQMQNLLANYKAVEVTKQFANEDIRNGPSGSAATVSRLAAAPTPSPKPATKPKPTSAPLWSSPATSASAKPSSSSSPKTAKPTSKTTPTALEAYQAILEGKTRLGGADEFSALQGIARIQTRRGQFDEALKTLHRAEPDKLQGVWKTNILKSIEVVKQAQK